MPMRIVFSPRLTWSSLKMCRYSRMRTAVKRLRGAVAAGDEKQASELLAETLSIVDATAQKTVIHRNAAARSKSRLTRAVKGLSAK